MGFTHYRIGGREMHWKISWFRNFFGEGVKIAAKEIISSLISEKLSLLCWVNQEVGRRQLDVRSSVWMIQVSWRNYFMMGARHGKPHSEKSYLVKFKMIFQDPAASLNERNSWLYHLWRFDQPPIAKNVRKKWKILCMRLTSFDNVISRIPQVANAQRIGITCAISSWNQNLSLRRTNLSLDVSVRAGLEPLKNSKRELGLYLFIAHDFGQLCASFLDRIAVIYKGVVEVAENRLELFNHPIHPYTQSRFFQQSQFQIQLRT